jgi:prepilin peptidase CpaA
MNEFQTFLELSGRLLREPRSAVLLGLLVTAAVIDVRSHRIPNWLTVSGIVFGLFYSAFGPFPLQDGILWSLGGLALGAGVMFPFYLMRVMGAGDVKLMGMVGVLLGPAGTWGAILGSCIAGGVLAIGYAIRHRRLRDLLGNVARILHLGGIAVLAGMPREMALKGWTSVGELPFGLAIAAGTISTVFALQYGLI